MKLARMILAAAWSQTQLLHRELGVAPRRRGGFWRLGLVIVVLVAGMPAVGAVADLASRFDQATRLYEQGKFGQAATAYQQLVAEGKVSAALYYNLGNAYFKAGQVGRAILNYRLAKRLAPRDPDVRANLRFARNSVADNPIRPVPFWRGWPTNLTLNEWALLGGFGLWVWFALLAAGQLWPVRRAGLRRYVVLAAGFWMLSVTGLCLAWQDQFQALEVVVVRRDAILRHGPLEESPSLQTLHDGHELTVLDQKDNWLQVRGAVRGVGWLKRDQVVELRP